MSENHKRDPFQYDFDQQWDVERELYGRLWVKESNKNKEQDDIDVLLPSVNRRGRDGEATAEHRKEPEQSVSGGKRPEGKGTKGKSQGIATAVSPGTTRMPPQPRKKPPVKGKKKGKPNYKGWAILGGLALGAILVLYLLISFFVWILTPGDKQEKEEPSSVLR